MDRNEYLKKLNEKYLEEYLVVVIDPATGNQSDCRVIRQPYDEFFDKNGCEPVKSAMQRLKQRSDVGKPKSDTESAA